MFDFQADAGTGSWLKPVNAAGAAYCGVMRLYCRRSSNKEGRKTLKYFRFALWAGVRFALAFALSCDVGLAWDPVRDLTGRSIDQHVERTGEKLERAGRNFLHNPVSYIASRPASLLFDMCSAIPLAYEGTLRGQVRHWQTLPRNLVQALQGQYATNLAAVRYAVGIRTSNGAAQTFGNVIYFPSNIDLTVRSDLHWMLHELEHVVQFEHASQGKSGKICEYMFKGVGRGFDHDSIDMERAAISKANYLIEYAHSIVAGQVNGRHVHSGRLRPNEIWVRNETPGPVEFVLSTASQSGTVLILPFSQQVLRAHPRDNAFRIDIQSNGQWASFYANGGTRQHIAWNEFGYLEAFIGN